MAAPPLKTLRTCSQCGHNGHNARTCTEHATTNNMNDSSNGFMLFGVKVVPTEGSSSANSISSPRCSSSSSSFMRKSMSMNNLSQYEQLHQHGHDHKDDGYASDDALHASGCRSRERKRGIPWTEEEHRLFLMGLSQVGKGDWRGISRNFVKTRTPTQVASHAQKYFLRRSNLNRRRRRSSLFDITTDTMTRSLSDGNLQQLDAIPLPKPATNQTKTTILAPSDPALLPKISSKHARLIPPSAKMASLNLNNSPISSPTSSTSTNSTTTTTTRDREFDFLSLKIQQAPSDEESSRRSSTFGGFNGNGESIISVA